MACGKPPAGGEGWVAYLFQTERQAVSETLQGSTRVRFEGSQGWQKAWSKDKGGGHSEKKLDQAAHGGAGWALWTWDSTLSTAGGARGLCTSKRHPPTPGFTRVPGLPCWAQTEGRGAWGALTWKTVSLGAGCSCWCWWDDAGLCISWKQSWTGLTEELDTSVKLCDVLEEIWCQTRLEPPGTHSQGPEPVLVQDAPFQCLSLYLCIFSCNPSC